MGTLENTYCKNTEDNLRRYKATGWTHIDKLDEGNDFIVARRNLGREICHMVSKDSGLLNHFRLIEDASPDVCYGIVGITESYSEGGFYVNNKPKDIIGMEGHAGIIELDCSMWKGGDSSTTNTVSVNVGFEFPIGLTTGSYVDVNNHVKQYGESNITTMLEHILSLQVHLTGGSYINVGDMIKELNKFGFHPNPNGRKIDE